MPVKGSLEPLWAIPRPCLRLEICSSKWFLYQLTSVSLGYLLGNKIARIHLRCTELETRAGVQQSMF